MLLFCYICDRFQNGKQVEPFLLENISCTFDIALLIGYFVAKEIGLYAMWVVYILQIAALGGFCFYRFTGGKWKSITVMESDPGNN